MSWGHSYFSKGCRHTLIKATLTNLPTYYLSIFYLRTVVARNIERMFRNFLWKGSKGSHGYHLLKWDDVKLPLEEGGLGIVDIKQKNPALLAKWHWCSAMKKMLHGGRSFLLNMV